MIRLSLIALVVGLGLPAAAHHSTAEFDLSRSTTLTGTVQSFQWSNPHVWLWVSVPRAGGGQDVWGIESGAPLMLRRSGMSRDSFQPAQQVTVTVHPLKDGQNGGQFMLAKFADGHELRSPDPAAFETPQVKPNS